ncbi:uncharacterized protein LOC130629404 [Hydractinia symbiolongicarpus]|uniref:uncharacterized protein LOC130629404 n=2 Tax=Hydractinia symbiolongicarpus TaxID=13093 RepID=UPI00254AC0E4|nr:uncharacterized protein LOC130629404 [Hydractinia symbiolongicarpus]
MDISENALFIALFIYFFLFLESPVNLVISFFYELASYSNVNFCQWYLPIKQNINFQYKCMHGLFFRYKNKEMKFAVQGCTHGDLDLIYSLIDHVEKKESIKIDFLICCGDFQATRNHDDLMSMAVPKKYRQMKDFHDYYAGRKKAPLLTIFIGGNHEAANHLWELPYGGWVAENIYYLGYAGVINVGGIRIAGMSGIFNTNDFHKGYFEKPPFNESTKRSFYHIKQITTAKLKHLEGSPIDIFLSHDWPSNIQKYGDIEQIYEQKPWLREEPIQKYLIDNDPAEELLRLLKPTYWFAAHHHVKFAALVQHDSKESTKFLALGKCLPSNDFMQILNFDSPSSEVVLKYDLQWLSVLKATDHYMKKSGKVDTFENFEKEQNFYMMTEASNFCSKFRENLAVIKLDSKSNLKSRQQTVKFCEKFGLCDPCVDYESCDYSNEISDDSIEFTN